MLQFYPLSFPFYKPPYKQNIINFILFHSLLQVQFLLFSHCNAKIEVSCAKTYTPHSFKFLYFVRQQTTVRIAELDKTMNTPFKEQFDRFV